MKLSPTPWSVDHEDNGDDVDRFDSYYIMDANGRKVCDTLNADAVVDFDGDEHGARAWDEQGRVNMERIVGAVNLDMPYLDLAAVKMEALRRDLVARMQAKGYPNANVDLDFRPGRVVFYMRTADARGPKAFRTPVPSMPDDYVFARGETFTEAHQEALAAIDGMDRAPDFSAWFDMAQLTERAAS